MRDKGCFIILVVISRKLLKFLKRGRSYLIPVLHCLLRRRSNDPPKTSSVSSPSEDRRFFPSTLRSRTPLASFPCSPSLTEFKTDEGVYRRRESRGPE